MKMGINPFWISLSSVIILLAAIPFVSSMAVSHLVLLALTVFASVFRISLGTRAQSRMHYWTSFWSVSSVIASLYVMELPTEVMSLQIAFFLLLLGMPFSPLNLFFLGSMAKESYRYLLTTLLLPQLAFLTFLGRLIHEAPENLGSFWADVLLGYGYVLSLYLVALGFFRKNLRIRLIVSFLFGLTLFLFSFQVSEVQEKSHLQIAVVIWWAMLWILWGRGSRLDRTQELVRWSALWVSPFFILVPLLSVLINQLIALDHVEILPVIACVVSSITIGEFQSFSTSHEMVFSRRWLLRFVPWILLMIIWQFWRRGGL